jgi:hypothetical protein
MLALVTDTTLLQAFRRFDAENARDPNRIACDGTERPRELVDAERLTAWVRRVAPDPSEALLLASRCQHLRRWEIPRDSFPQGRHGYLAWRRALAEHHANSATAILEELGYDAPTISTVRAINLKQDRSENPDAQAMEDALCLSFLEHELLDFSRKHEPDKVVSILRKTWRKMSPRGHALALELEFEPEVRGLVARATGG